MSLVGVFFMFFIIALKIKLPPETFFNAGIEALINPIDSLERASNVKHELIVKLTGIGIIIFIWIAPLLLLFDLFWIHSTINKTTQHAHTTTG